MKTYPVPSAGHHEIVCTAALDEETGKLARLYPLAFRTLAEAQRFSKWDWITAMIYAGSDGRPDSWRIDATTIEVVGHEPANAGWPRRWQFLAPLVASSLEDLDQRRRAGGATLGLIKPTKYSLRFADVDPHWSSDEVQKLISAQGAIDMFGALRQPARLLEKLPVEIKYRYRCAGSLCKGHLQKFEDWEAGESYRKWRRRYPQQVELRAKFVERYVSIPRQKDNLFLFVGTLAQHQHTWVVIGQVQPQLARPSVQRKGSSSLQSVQLPLIGGI